MFIKVIRLITPGIYTRFGINHSHSKLFLEKLHTKRQKIQTKMLVNQKPQRMAFTIENLAKSSREESFPEVPLTFPNLPPIGFAPRLQLLDNYTPVKLQATVIPSMSTPKTNSKRKRNHSEVSDTESTTSSRSKSTSEESSESFGAFISGMYHSISIVKKNHFRIHFLKVHCYRTYVHASKQSSAHGILNIWNCRQKCEITYYTTI